MAHTINVRDLAVTGGSAAFITCRFRRLASGKLVGFHFREHFDRLIQSCEALGLAPCPRLFTLESLQEFIDARDRVRRFKCGYPEDKETVVRVIVTAGKSWDAATTEKNRERLIILQDFYKPPLVEPLKLKLVEGMHQMPDVKVTGKYAVPRIYRDKARKEGFDDILFYTGDGMGECYVSESFNANFFIINADGWLITPKRHVLPGVTRGIILSLAEKSSLFQRVGEADYLLHVGSFSRREAFLTSTTRGAIPVARLQESSGRYWNFQTGPDTLTAKLQKLYNDYVERYFSEEGC